jgi:hypothetical protein
MNKNRTLLIFVFFYFSFFSLGISEETKFVRIDNFLKNTLNLNTSLNIGNEYDDNVLKIQDKSQKLNDFLFRFFLNLDGRYFLTQNDSIKFMYQGGAKKYFDETSEDTALNYGLLGYDKNFENDFFLNVNTEIKSKLERIDDENFLLSGGNVVFGKEFQDIITPSVDVRYTYFNFSSLPAYGFHKGRYGLSLKRKIIPNLIGEVDYYFQNQKFFDVLSGYDEKRSDYLNEIGAYLIYDKELIFRLGYVFQDSNSNLANLSFTNHIVTIEASRHLFWGLTFMAWGLLQIKSYSVSAVTEEAERFLRTETEEANFNSIIAKLSKQITEWFFIDFKYSRFSNELSSANDDFSRNVFNLGVRFTF